MNWRRTACIAAAVSGVSFCLLQSELRRESTTYNDYIAVIESSEGLLLTCLALWCSTFLWITYRRNDWPLWGLLAVAIGAHLIEGLNQSSLELRLLLFGVTLGKGTRCLLTKTTAPESERLVKTVLFCLVTVLALLSLPHLDTSHAYFDLPPRWAGLWKNPNVYAALMATGVVLAGGLLGTNQGLGKSDREESKIALEGTWSSNRWFCAGLVVAAGMMIIGLFFSYSRGAWLAAVAGLIYLARFYGKLKWQAVLPALVAIAMVVLCFWGRTPDSAPWYIKRADLGRPSAQHRASAWGAGLKMMRDHPFGVGWNNAVRIYQERYSPPEGGAAALTTNDYLMLGTQLGVLGLAFFATYAVLCLRNETTEGVAAAKANANKSCVQRPVAAISALKATCRSGSIVMLVVFWFDGGMFNLATAGLFWVLLELGSARD